MNDTNTLALEVSVLWGDVVLDAVRVQSPREVTVSCRGSDHEADLHVEPALLVDRYTCAVHLGRSASVVVPLESEAQFFDADGNVQSMPIATHSDAPFPAAAARIGEGERLNFRLGALTFAFRLVESAARMRQVPTIDFEYLRFFGASAAAHAFLIALALLTPDLSLATDALSRTNVWDPAAAVFKPASSPEAGGAAAHGPEGLFGPNERARVAPSERSRRRGARRDGRSNREVALSSGLVAQLRALGGAGAGVLMNENPGFGGGLSEAMSGLNGATCDDCGGGIGARFFGTGGPGGPGGPIGLGRLPGGSGPGPGGDGVELEGRPGPRVRVPGGTLIVDGLSKSEINRVIRRNLPRFKYCYERQLQSDPNLRGKVTVKFTIAPTGAIAQASAVRGLGNAAVEGCVLKVMRSLEFPKPKGGGIVVVRYPFIFAST